MRYLGLFGSARKHHLVQTNKARVRSESGGKGRGRGGARVQVGGVREGPKGGEGSHKGGIVKCLGE